MNGQSGTEQRDFFAPSNLPLPEPVQSVLSLCTFTKMRRAYFEGPTLDDVMRDVVEEVFCRGERIYPTRGGTDGALEITGVLLEISNPRARLSRTETRGRIFSALGELLWYLSASNDVEFVSYYIQEYEHLAENGKVFGGYGPRLFSWRGVDQISNITKILRTKKDSRKAVLQLFDAVDLATDHKDVPCTCTIQFMLRQGRLHVFTNMRSNDIYWGLPHDVFCFTMLQELVARSVGVDLGTYKHAVGSLHLYIKHASPTKRFLKEGFQKTSPLMRPMPDGDQWPAVERVLQAESAIRKRERSEEPWIANIDPYWRDIIRLLQVFDAKKHKELDRVVRFRTMMSDTVYLPFIDRVIRKMKAVIPIQDKP